MLTHGSEAKLTSAHRSANVERLNRGGNRHPAVTDIERRCTQYRSERDQLRAALDEIIRSAYARDSKAFNEALRAARPLIEASSTTT